MNLLFLSISLATVFASPAPRRPAPSLRTTRLLQDNGSPGMFGSIFQTITQNWNEDRQEDFNELADAVGNLITTITSGGDGSAKEPGANDALIVDGEDGEEEGTTQIEDGEERTTQAPTLAPVPAPTETPTDSKSNVPTPAPAPFPTALPTLSPSAAPIAAPSDTPSLVPSAAPSDTPHMVPSDTSTAAPSVTPTYTPSLAPSDTPSRVPSDTPSLVPSDTPSLVPSDAPSIVPSSWDGTTTTEGPPPGFEICGMSDGIDFSKLSEIQVIYLYKLSLVGSVDLTSTIEIIEDDLQQAVMDGTCRDGAARHRSLAQAHAISREPKDIPSASCGEDCYFMIGRASMLVDSDTIAEYREAYCQTLGVIRDRIHSDLGLVYPQEIKSTSLLLGEPGAPDMCNYAVPEDVADDTAVINNGPAPIIDDREVQPSTQDGQIGVILAMFGFIGLASGLIVAAIIRLRKRRGAQGSLGSSGSDSSNQRDPDADEDQESASEGDVPEESLPSASGSPLGLVQTDSDRLDPYLTSPSAHSPNSVPFDQSPKEEDKQLSPKSVPYAVSPTESNREQALASTSTF